MTERDKIFEQLSAYLDGELGEAQAQRVEQALRDDPQLAQELSRLRATRELVHALPRAKAPEDFVSLVLSRAERLHLVSERQAAQRAPRTVRWIGHLASAAVVLIASSIVLTVVVSLYSAFKIHQNTVVAGGDKAGRISYPSDAKWKTGEKRLGPGSVAEALPDSAPAGGGMAGLFRGKIAGTSGKADEDAVANVVIWTDNLPKAQREMEKALRDTNVRPVHELALNKAKGVSGPIGNNYYVSRDRDESIEINVTVDSADAPKVAQAVDDLQAKQQTVTLALADMPAKDATGDRYRYSRSSHGTPAGKEGLDKGGEAEVAAKPGAAPSSPPNATAGKSELKATLPKAPLPSPSEDREPTHVAKEAPGSEVQSPATRPAKRDPQTRPAEAQEESLDRIVQQKLNNNDLLRNYSERDRAWGVREQVASAATQPATGATSSPARQAGWDYGQTQATGGGNQHRQSGNITGNMGNVGVQRLMITLKYRPALSGQANDACYERAASKASAEQQTETKRR